MIIMSSISDALLSAPTGDKAAWFAGTATFLTFLVAFAQIAIERRIRRDNEAKEQAERISAYVAKEKGYKAQIEVLNSSFEPIYEAIISLVAFQGAQSTHHIAFLSVVPPGKYFVSIDANYHGMSFHPSIEIAFTDARGKNWVRFGRGELRQIGQSSTDYYHLSRPLTWTLPKQDRPL